MSLFGREGPQHAKGRFKAYEVRASRIVPLIVLCLWKEVFMQFPFATASALLRAHSGGGKNEDVLGVASGAS